MAKLSTGQVYNPVIKQKLKETFSKDNMKAIGANSITRVSNGFHNTATGATASALDMFLGQGAGDWARSRFEPKEDHNEKKLKFKDYLTIIKSEISSLLGKHHEIVEEKKEEVKKEKPTLKKATEPKGMAKLGVESSGDLETLINEMKKTSEDELLKYIDANKITDAKLIDELIEATHHANKEVEKGLRKQWFKENPQSKTLERVAKATESMEKIMKGEGQDIYAGKDGKKPSTPIEEKKEDKKADGVKGIFDSLNDIKIPNLAGIAESLQSVFSVLGRLAPVAGTIATVLGPALVGGYLGKKVQDWQAEREAQNEELDKKQAGEGIDFERMKDFSDGGKTALGNFFTGKSGEVGRQAAIVEEKLKDPTQTFSPEEAKLIEQKLGVEIPANRIGKSNLETLPGQSSQQAQSKDMSAASDKLATNKATQASAPVVVSAPTNVSNGNGAPQEVLNYETQNNDNTMRRLNDKSLSLAYI